MGSEHFALFGLGNPGSKYEMTRHNAGFMLVDWFGDQYSASFRMDKFGSLSATIRIRGTRITLLKPQTFMNRSGSAVAGFANYYDIEPGNVLVAHDDIDMANGRMKLVRGGGAGGHNGIRSIMSSLGNGEFFRLKMGVGRPGSDDTPDRMEVDKYVLAPFANGQLELLESCFDDIAQGLTYFFAGDFSRAQTIINAIK